MSCEVNIWRLRCFAALAEELHFGRAASRLFITQPALSLQIKQLEISLGYDVVTRARSVALTANGRRLLPYAAQVLAAADVFANAAAVGGRLHAA
ncbi:LysR family transcriptional regulator [Agrococcus sp. ProA11]|uniref:LysR family transcriptional regulator n=1 Tax=Agrococcus chionoecetis TaxID=3153752 RepID=UPI003261CC31